MAFKVFLIVLSCLLVVIAVAACSLLIRVRMIGRIVGTFECWTRPDMNSSWVAGMARFGREDFQWFKLVGFLYGPQYRLSRRGTTVSVPVQREDTEVVEVVLTTEGERLYLAMRPEWYNGLVSWLESGPPRSRRLY